MSLMKSSEGKRFSGELRIFISHTRNLTCRLVGSGNLSHEIVLLRVASSPAAVGNYLTHRLPLDRLPSVEMHLLPPKSAPVPLPTSLGSWCGSPAAAEGSPAPPQHPEPLCRELRAREGVIPSPTLAPRTSPQQSRAGTAEPPAAALGLGGTPQPHGPSPRPRFGASYPSPSASVHAGVDGSRPT